ncbi:unnamed protein product, partial [Dibothriocephalus latus]
MPTGCGEQTMVRVAPSVYAFKYLIAAADLQEPEIKQLAQTAINNIVSVFSRQLNYRLRDGSFSVFGSRPGSTWLTAFVFGVFSEAEQLLQNEALQNLENVNINLDPALYTAFEFLQQKQHANGCFVEYGYFFQPDLQAFDSSPRSSSLKDLMLTSYVLSALLEAPVRLKETNSQSYANVTDSASRCLLNTVDSFNISQIPSKALVKVAYTLRRPSEQPGYSETRELVYRELINRASERDSLRGTLRWWQDNKRTSPASKVEMTAYAYLALTEYQPVSQLRPIIRWLLTQQNERGGFYSPQDTVIALRALAHAAAQPHLSTGGKAHAQVTASILP